MLLKGSVKKKLLRSAMAQGDGLLALARILNVTLAVSLRRRAAACALFSPAANVCRLG